MPGRRRGAVLQTPGAAPELTPDVIADAKARFKALLGEGSYKICHSSSGGGMSFGAVTTIVDRAPGGLSVAFELGWED